MKKFTEILGSQYPIIAMAMNQVSDLNLAKAVRAAGAIPSLSIFNYEDSGITSLITDLDDYRETFGDLKILLSLGESEITNTDILNLIIDNKIEFIELIPDGHAEPQYNEENTKKTAQAVQLLYKNNIKIFVKCLGFLNVMPGITGVILKGKEGAGRGTWSLHGLFDAIKTKHPNLDIVVSGGIGTADQVKYYMDNGALAIGVGTLLAASEESLVSTATKLKMVNSDLTDIKRFDDAAKQNALIFQKQEIDDFNHTTGLSMGIRTSTEGHIFAGASIQQITEIKPVTDIIQMLVEKL